MEDTAITFLAILLCLQFPIHALTSERSKRFKRNATYGFVLFFFLGPLSTWVGYMLHGEQGEPLWPILITSFYEWFFRVALLCVLLLPATLYKVGSWWGQAWRETMAADNLEDSENSAKK